MSRKTTNTERSFSINNLPYEGDIPVDPEIISAFRISIQEQRNAEILISNYKYEDAICRCVRDGNIDKLSDRLKTANHHLYFGYFSNNQFRKAQYLYIASITIITRYAIQGGLSETFAYTLSDVYIQKTDECSSILELWHFFDMAIFDFTRRVNNAKLESTTSYPVMESKIYVARHLFEHITLKETADYCNVTAPYLSSLFKKETGMTFKEYIRIEKMNIAAKMLNDEEYSILEIANALSISSSSAFSVQFRSVYNMTPSEYRLAAINEKRGC